ncbi:MAG TPA: hypothetical protein DDY31_10075 [Lachnospiraceae bacterium]|nr:hypothetical protein [Lachnospiraceae bacterium]
MDGIKGLKVTHKKSLIRELDKIHFWRCKNLKMGTALCAVLALREEWNLEKYRELKERLGNIGKYDLRFDCGSKDIPCFILSSYNIGRPDQTEMFVRLTGLFQDKYVMKAVKDRSVYNGVKLSVIFVWFWQMRKLRITLLQKKMILLYMYIYHAEADYVFSEFNKRRNGIKIVAVFDDIFPIDNMIVQLCKKTGLKTATFHHAIINGSYKYIDYRYSV